MGGETIALFCEIQAKVESHEGLQTFSAQIYAMYVTNDSQSGTGRIW